MKSARELEQDRIINATSPYEILDIPPNATDADIKSAYRKLSLKYHPDKNRDDLEKSNVIVKKLNVAYETLTGKLDNIKYEKSAGTPTKGSEYQPTEQSIKLDLKHRIESLEIYLQYYLDNVPKGLFNIQSSVISKLNALYDHMSNEINESADYAFKSGIFSNIQSTTSFYQEIKTTLEDISKNENINEGHEHYKCLNHCMNLMNGNYQDESLDEKTKFVNNIPDRIIEFSNTILESKGLGKIDKSIFKDHKSSIDSNDNRLHGMYPPKNFAASFNALPKGIQEMINLNRLWKVNYKSDVKSRVIFTFDLIEKFLDEKVREKKILSFFNPFVKPEVDNFYISMLEDMKKISAPKMEEKKRYSR